MAPIRNWCFVFAHRFQELAAGGISMAQARRHGMMLGEELRVQQQEFIHHQIQAARPLLDGSKSVVTLSYSSTVESILLHALPLGCRVTIAESRPLNEGRRLFKRLLGRVANIRMITDAQMGLVIPTADLVLVGADAILRDLGVVNKAGTYLAALVAQAHHRRFFVAADTYKINALAGSRECELESKSGSEVWRSQDKRCDNVYFDITPVQLVTGFLSEKGILDASGMSKHIERWKNLTQALSV